MCEASARSRLIFPAAIRPATERDTVQAVDVVVFNQFFQDAEGTAIDRLNFQDRIARLQAEIQAQGFDTVLQSTEPNVVYCTELQDGY